MTKFSMGELELKIIRTLLWSWRSSPTWIAKLLTLAARCLPSKLWARVWYELAYDACRGINIPQNRALSLLPALGTYPKQPIRPRLKPPLWWALASRQDDDGFSIYQWAAKVGIPLDGRHFSYDFLIASIYAKNKLGFLWGMAQNLPPDGAPVEPIAPKAYTCVSNIESDLRTPLWHAVNLTSVSDPWWVESLVQAGAHWDFAGQGKVSAADLDRERGLGWSQWWKRRELLGMASARIKEKQETAAPLM